jgi:hypothetical protein
MREGGLRLHEWLFNTSASEVDPEGEREVSATTGAVVLGRRTFDVGVGVCARLALAMPTAGRALGPPAPAGAYRLLSR